MLNRGKVVIFYFFPIPGFASNLGTENSMLPYFSDFAVHIAPLRVGSAVTEKHQFELRITFDIMCRLQISLLLCTVPVRLRGS